MIKEAQHVLLDVEVGEDGEIELLDTFFLDAITTKQKPREHASEKHNTKNLQNFEVVCNGGRIHFAAVSIKTPSLLTVFAERFCLS